MNITANKSFYIKAALTSAITILFMYVLTHYFSFGVDAQVIKSSEYDYFIINKFQKTAEKDEYIAYQTKALPPYFKEGSVFIKKVKGLPGDIIVVKDGYQSINDSEPEYLHLIKALKKDINDFDRKVVVDTGALWVMGTTKSSYDSRYTGAIQAARIIGRAYPLW